MLQRELEINDIFNLDSTKKAQSQHCFKILFIGTHIHPFLTQSRVGVHAVPII